MTSEESNLLQKRKSEFDGFYKQLIPCLVDFVEKLGISPAHLVLKEADSVLPLLDQALTNMIVADEEDRIWLLTRIGYFVGEYFVQKYSGCWYVNEIQGSRYFGRYVVGKFARMQNISLMLDPFQVAQIYVDSPIPRALGGLLMNVNNELIGAQRQ